MGPLDAHGVTPFDIGAIDICTIPDVPALFVWRDPEGASLVLMHHHHYRDVVQVPYSDYDSSYYHARRSTLQSEHHLEPARG